jgi:hypothetical protein
MSAYDNGTIGYQGLYSRTQGVYTFVGAGGVQADRVIRCEI